MSKTLKDPKVSIVIPCYNEDKHVSRAIMSAFTQSYRGDIEVIIVDDGSTDDTWSISRLFTERTGKRTLKVIHKANGGKASALSLGAKEAGGSIIIMTDGDSQLERNAVLEIVETFKMYPDAGIVGGFVSIRNVDSGYLTKLQQFEYVITQHLIRMNQSDDGSVLIAPGPIFGIRSDIAKSMNPLSRTVVEDCDLTMSVLGAGWTTRSTRKAISITNAPTTWKAWTRQRKRWIFGQFQAWRENSWHLKKRPWAIYTYLTWVSTSISAFVFVMMLLLTGMFVISNNDYYSYFSFITLRTGIILWVYFLTRGLILLLYKETRSILHLLPLMVIYDMIAGFLTAYLYSIYLTKAGIRLRWGNRNEVVN